MTPPGRRSSSPRCGGRASALRARRRWRRAARRARARRRSRQARWKVARAEERRLQRAARAARRRRRVAAMPSRPRCSTSVRADVGPLRHAERHARGRRTQPRARITRGIVGVGDEQVGRAGACSRISALASAMASADAKKPEVRVADVGPDAHVGLGDADQRADFTSVIHAELDHGDVRPRPQLEQRQRQADVVVQVPLVAEHAVPRRQELRGQLPSSSSCRRCR